MANNQEIQICVACGEQEAVHDEMCVDCNISVMEVMGFADVGFSYDDDPGYRTCNCEDYPCCGH
jgi:hypothetical protein